MFPRLIGESVRPPDKIADSTSTESNPKYGITVAPSMRIDFNVPLLLDHRHDDVALSWIGVVRDIHCNAPVPKNKHAVRKAQEFW